MADTVGVDVVFAGTNRRIYRLTGISDGTGEADVVKIDVSALTGPKGSAVNYLTIEKAAWNIQGYSSIRLEFDATTDDEALILSGVGERTFPGGFKDPKSTGTTGDLLLSTVGHAANATYDILLHVKLKNN